ncbi:hypothetical protein ACFLX2_01160 [Candidatus Dependentiae bacterium]
MDTSKKTALIVLASFSISLSASTDSVTKEKKENGKNNIFSAVSLKLKKCRDTAVRFIKNHPFIAMTVLITIISEKMRSALWHLPENLWDDAQEYPIAMAVLGGFLLSYLLKVT